MSVFENYNLDYTWMIPYKKNATLFANPDEAKKRF